MRVKRNTVPSLTGVGGVKESTAAATRGPQTRGLHLSPCYTPLHTHNHQGVHSLSPQKAGFYCSVSVFTLWTSLVN